MPPKEKKQTQIHVPLQQYHTAGLVEAGCDEAGRGCLAGPVFAASVILPSDFYHPLLNDSKQVSEKHRMQLRELIMANAVSYAVAMLDHKEIDKINILNASIKGMQLAVDQLHVRPELLLIDGNRFKPYPGIKHLTVVGGDAKFASIAAASILAKTGRDLYMEELHEQFPQYNWAKNKGYPTADHRNAIREHGISPYHRRSFRLLPDPELF